MAGTCPAPALDDPMVQGLLGVVDCNVRDLVHTGYMAIFQPGQALSGLLTALLTVYVATIGYRLLTGRSQLSVSEFALNAVKLGLVLALATRWDAYQTVVYNVLFHGPQQLADLVFRGARADGQLFHGDVFDGLQTAFDSLSQFGAAYASHTPVGASPLLGGAGFAAFLLTASASVLLLSSLGVLLISKIVLGLLLALGPLFIALLLFESTRGVFEGWLRATLAFAFAPLAATVILGLTLTMLEPSLIQLADLQKQNVFVLAPAYSVMILILVFTGVSIGALAAGGMIAMGFRLPRPAEGKVASERAAASPAAAVVAGQSRAARVAAATTALDRRDSATLVAEHHASDRRSAVVSTVERAGRDGPEVVRLGQQSPNRRVFGPRTARPNARIAR